ncbi:hypothetical protein ACFQ46_11635 [Kineococcus sp. GCM10028916]|uniref:hypothetical protein n=1 Tax=Kineococcus sp. GCM10028916 TaxID=3273394 RepID=UPI0036330FB1
MSREPSAVSAARLEATAAAMISEWNSIRAESIGAIANRMAIANFSFGALALMVAGLINKDHPSLVVGWVGILFIPTIAKCCVLMWLGEYQRSQRAGRGLVKAEVKINSELRQSAAVTWESELHSPNTHMGYPYVATIGALLATGWAAWIVGVQYNSHWLRGVLPWWQGDGLVWSIVAALVSIEAIFIVSIKKKWNTIRLGYR